MGKLKEDLKVLVLSGLVLSLLIGTIFALSFGADIFPQRGTAYTINESQESAINITINTSYTDIGSLATNATAFLWGNFNYTLSSQKTNSTITITFTNTSRVLTWTNTTALLNTSAANSAMRISFNVSATQPGNYTITVQIGNSTMFNQTNITIAVNDTIAPTIDYGAGTQANHYNNSISNVYVDASVVENNEANITFGLYYNNGTVYNTSIYTNATRARNWTGLSDGFYVYNVTIADNLGVVGLNTHVAYTATRNITVDATVPSVTHSCTPSSVIDGEVITCTCSATDVTAGVNSTTYTIHPTTNVVGTFYTACIAKDYIGNTATSNLSYTVSGASGDSGGAGGGAQLEYTQTYVYDSKELSEQGEIKKELSSKSRIKVQIDNTKHYVGVTNVAATSAEIEVSSTPQKATLSVGDEKKFDVTGDGYYDVYVKLESIESSKANITLKSIYEKIISEEGGEEGIGEGEIATPPAATGKNWIWWIVGIIILIAIGVGYGVKKKR